MYVRARAMEGHRYAYAITTCATQHITTTSADAARLGSAAATDGLAVGDDVGGGPKGTRSVGMAVSPSVSERATPASAHIAMLRI